MQPGFLTTKDLIIRWNVAYNTLYKWRLKGFGPKFHKMGTRVNYRLEDIEAFENNSRCRSTSEYPLKDLEQTIDQQRKNTRTEKFSGYAIPFRKKGN